MAEDETQSQQRPSQDPEVADFMPPPAVKPQVQGTGKNPLMAKTILDLEACRQVMSRMIADKEVKASEQVRSAPGEAPKPEQPIETYRLATPCQATWDSMVGTNQFRVCRECAKTVYDFTAMELPAAQALVYKREGQKDAVNFYRRKDGKFLTADCPVGVKRGRMMLMMVIGGVVVVVGIIAFMMLNPPSPPSVTVLNSSPGVKSDKVGGASSAGTSKSSAEALPTIHYGKGQDPSNWEPLPPPPGVGGEPGVAPEPQANVTPMPAGSDLPAAVAPSSPDALPPSAAPQASPAVPSSVSSPDGEGKPSPSQYIKTYP